MSAHHGEGKVAGRRDQRRVSREVYGVDGDAANNPCESDDRFQETPCANKKGSAAGSNALEGNNEDFNAENFNDSFSSPERAGGDCCASCPSINRVMNCLGGVVHKLFPPGGVLSTALILSSAAIGAGILGLPGAMNSCGLVLAIIFLVLFAFFTACSLRMISMGLEKTGARTFEGLISILFPHWHHAFAYWAGFIRWFYAVGCCVGYIISIQDLFKPIFTEASRRKPDSTSLEYIASTNGRRLVAFLIWLVIILPMVVPKHIDSLRYASLVAIAFMLYFCIMIVVHSCMNGLPEHKDKVRLSGHTGRDDGDYIYLFRTGNAALGELGTFMFAFILQNNAVECHLDLRPEIRNSHTMTKAAIVAMGITFLIYLFVSIFGYFDFAAAALSTKSILLMYNPLDNVGVMLAYVGVLVKLCVAYALQHIGARNSIYYAIGWTTKYREAMNPKKSKKKQQQQQHQNKSATPTGELEGNLEPDALDEEQDEIPVAASDVVETVTKDTDRTFVDNIPMWQHLIVVGVLSAVCLLCGLFIPNINIVFGFAGSICGGFLGFIFPALIVMYCGDFTPQKVGWFMYVLAYVMLAVGVIGIVFGTGATIYSLAGGE